MTQDNTPREPINPQVRMAGERTMLAWVRTGTALMGFGFVVAKFGLFLRELAAASQAHTGTPPAESTVRSSLGLGVFLIVMGILFTLGAARQHFVFLRRIDAGEPYQPPRWSLETVLAVVMAGLGMALAVYVVWAAR
jgi:putative membrane protein